LAIEKNPFPGLTRMLGPEVLISRPQKRTFIYTRLRGRLKSSRQTDPREKDTKFVREIKSDEKIKAGPLELNPVPGSFEAGNLKQASKQNSYLQNQVYRNSVNTVKRVLKILYS